MAFGAVVFSVGCDYANAFVVGRQPAKVLQVVWNTVWVALAVSFLVPLWTLGFVKLFPQTLLGLGSLGWLGFALFAASTVLLSLQQGMQAATIGLELYNLVARANLLSGVLWAIGALITVHISYAAVLAAWTLSLAIVPLYYMHVHGANLLRPSRMDRSLLRQQLHFGIRTVPGGIARSLNMRATLYMCSAFLSPADVGVYGLMLTLAETMLYLPNALSQIILGTSAARKTRASEYHGLYALLAFAGLGASLLAFGFGGSILSAVFSPAYARGSVALGILFLAVTAHSLGLMHLHHLYGSGNPLAATTGQIIALVLTLVGGRIIIPHYGMMGAAASSLLTYAGFSTYLQWTHRSARGN
jgi:O-antigen/teichoic acid export membrane protein